jgi:mono/diheme cytochrome c family protein
MKTSKQIALLSRLAASALTAAFVSVLIATCSMAQAAQASQELVKRGAYLARAGDCIACHTTPKGKSYAGGSPIATPMGVIYSTNITPDSKTGIGHYSLDDFVKAMREGVTETGEHIYPAMPYTSYTKLTKEDLAALYAYFMQGVEPVRQPNRPTKLSWPRSMRSLMAVWNALYLKKGEYVPDPNKSASWNRGAYLVQGLGHCGGCHTPRGFLGQEKAESEKDGRKYLSGALLDNWYALPLTGDRKIGLYAWSRADIVEYLKTGRTARVAAVGMMAEVVNKSTQYLTAQDLMSLAEYLKSLPPSIDEGQGNAGPAMKASDASVATRALRAGDTEMRGSRIYLDNCNACHRSDGSGVIRTFPNLINNEAVNAENPISLIHIVLEGGAMPSTQTSPTAFAMPPLGWRLSDTEIADVLSFVRGNWGNHAPEVSHKEVGRVRKVLDIEKTKR